MNLTDRIEGREVEWLELNLLSTGNRLSKSTFVSLGNIENESELDGWLTELERRNTFFKNPIYEFEGNLVRPLYKWHEIPEYFLCVFFAYFGASNNSYGTKLFEKISAHALRNFLDCEIYVLGFPEGKNLNEYLDEISENVHEDRGTQAHPDYKDDGVDVIGYKIFGDNRSGNMYVLLQCAAGVNWTTKHSIPVQRWTKYIDWYDSTIILSISTTEFVTTRDWFKRVSTYGIVFDRSRIYNYLYSKDVDVELKTDTTTWCQAELETV